MDTGLKKLWARRKSKDDDGRKDSAVSGLRKSEGTEQTHFSTSASPPFLRVHTFSTDRETYPSSPPTGSKFRPMSNGHGASRPLISRSRATDDGGSILLAVNRAADAVSKAEQDFQISATRYTHKHVRPSTPRYIDIFSLSGSSSPNRRPGYNEDIAVRNLDMARVALEGSHSYYVPSSRYQEEVAARNAHPSLTSTPATSPSVLPAVFNFGQPDQARGLPGAVGVPSQSPRRLEGRSLSSQSYQTHNLAGLHPRQQSDKSAQPRRPVLPHALSSYQLSASEKTQMRYTDSPSLSQRPEYSKRSTSNLSNLSSGSRVINLQNRTIMDLTGDDFDVSTETAPAPDLKSSPALDNARLATTRTAQEPAVHLSTRIRSDSSQPASKIPAHTEGEVSQARAPSLEPVFDPPTARVQAAASRLISSFAPIFTLASSSPRNSLVIDKATASTAEKDLLQTQNVDESHRHGRAKLATESAPREGDMVSEQSSPAGSSTPPLDTNTIFDEVLLVEDKNGIRSKRVEQVATQRAGLVRDPRPTPVRGAYIHLSSETSGKPGVPSSVLSRDFATTATKQTLTSVPEDTETNPDDHVPSLAKETSPGKDGLSATRKDTMLAYTSTFDELQFSQKQAEAREALVRLQLSLNEDFLSVPSTKSSPSKPKSTFSDGKPAAPGTTIVRSSEPSPNVQDRSAYFDIPARPESAGTPYHHLTTVLQRRGSAPELEDNSWPFMGRTAKSLGKGKEREIDLNGPGPSVWNSPSKQPLPLPPPLKLSHHPFQQRFSLPVVPPSPGEISLSHFPIPVSLPRRPAPKPFAISSSEKDHSASRPPFHKTVSNPLPGSTPGTEDWFLRRKSSTQSQSSSTSAFSIPYHMIPDRSSSARDHVVMEGNNG